MDGSERFDDTSIVLVSPAGLRNIGSAARAMMNTGFRDLVLVAPPRGFRCRESYDMAVSARGLVGGARVFASLPEAVRDRHALFGLTARRRFKRRRLTPDAAAAAWLRERAAGRKTALLFGPEDHGLSNEHLDLCRHLVAIPAHPDLASYNLAQAVLLICHAFFSAAAGGAEQDADGRELSPLEDRRRIEDAAAGLLKEAGYLTPARAGPVEGTLRRVVYGGEIETRDTRNVLAAIRHLRHLLGRRGR